MRRLRGSTDVGADILRSVRGRDVGGVLVVDAAGVDGGGVQCRSVGLFMCDVRFHMRPMSVWVESSAANCGAICVRRALSGKATGCVPLASNKTRAPFHFLLYTPMTHMYETAIPDVAQTSTDSSPLRIRTDNIRVFVLHHPSTHPIIISQFPALPEPLFHTTYQTPNQLHKQPVTHAQSPAAHFQVPQPSLMPSSQQKAPLSIPLLSNALLLRVRHLISHSLTPIQSQTVLQNRRRSLSQRV